MTNHIWPSVGFYGMLILVNTVFARALMTGQVTNYDMDTKINFMNMIDKHIVLQTIMYIKEL